MIIVFDKAHMDAHFLMLSKQKTDVKLGWMLASHKKNLRRQTAKIQRTCLDDMATKLTRKEPLCTSLQIAHKIEQHDVSKCCCTYT